MSARLREMLEAAADGRYPPADGRVTVTDAPDGPAAAIVAFTSHHVVAANVDVAWVEERCPAWQLAAPFGPRFMLDLAGRLGVGPGTQDLVLMAQGIEPSRLDLDPAVRSRIDAFLAGAPDPHSKMSLHREAEGIGWLSVGRGLEGRWEAALDVEPEARGQGLGRALLLAARALVGPGERVFAQIAPGNLASLRAALGAGYRPFAAEILFHHVS